MDSTSRNLLLMRHAKSDWNQSGLADIDRPLNQRGRSAAPLMAEWMVQNSYLPDSILCSSAVRTRQTLELMIQRWTAIQEHGPKIVLPTVIVDDGLYLASDAHILAAAKFNAENDEAKHCILVLGHNPGMEVLAGKLGGIALQMPTAAIAILTTESIDGMWPSDWSNHKLWKWRGLVKPRELGESTI